jgi:methyl-accepting chemotaxis protein
MLGNLKIAHKVLLAMAVLAAVAVLSGLFATTRMRAIDDSYSALIDHEAEAVKAIARANVRVVSTGRQQYVLIAARNEAEREVVNKRMVTLRQDFHALTDKAAAALPQYRSRLEAAARDLDAIKPIADEVAALDAKQEEAAAITMMVERFDPALDKVRDTLTAINDDVSAAMQKHSDELTATTNSTITGTTVGVLAGVAASVALALLITTFGVSRPLSSLASTMETLSKGNFGVGVDGTDRKDEVGAMAKSLLVFKENGQAMERMRHEQEEAKAKAERDRRQSMLSLADSFESQVRGIVQSVSAQATQLESTSGSLSAVAEQTSRQSSIVAAAAEEASSNVQTVAAAAEELSASIGEIGRQVSQSATMSREAVEEARRTNEIVTSLAGAAQKIGEVVSLITDIAAQTNLLALNATIEAARAGDAGKGFAVVAGEVKNLANQTARATDDISKQIGDIQTATRGAVHAIEGITGSISNINQVASAIASSVEEQGAATQEIARNVQQAAQGTNEVSNTIAGVQQGAAEVGNNAGETRRAAQTLNGQAGALSTQIDRFIATIRAG